VAAALDITQKDLRNFLQRCDLSELQPGRQGVRQRMSVRSVRTVRLAWELHQMGLPARFAGRLAERLIEGHPWVDASGIVVLSADLGRLTDVVDIRLAEASQTVVVRRRGRPRQRTT
jgi:hypothetical protein